MEIVTRSGHIVVGYPVERDSGWLFDHATVDGLSRVNVLVPHDDCLWVRDSTCG